MPNSIKSKWHFLPSADAASAGPACILTQASDMNVSNAGGGTSEAIRTINPDGVPVGWRHGQKPNHQLTFNSSVLETKEIDWVALEESKAEFGFTKANVVYEMHYLKGVVQTCEETEDDAGNTTWNVTCEFLERKYNRL